jgi:hypothetical protein
MKLLEVKVTERVISPHLTDAHFNGAGLQKPVKK